MAGYPIRYVVRAVRDDDKVVACFASPVYLFEEAKDITQMARLNIDMRLILLSKFMMKSLKLKIRQH